MPLISLNSENKEKQLKAFLDAPEGQNFGHETVALYLGCSPWTLAKMRCNGSTLPYIKVGRRVAYKKSDVLAYEESRKVTCTAQQTS